jgi:O-antigen ligase/cytochrome c-type biogenesis protein CcmH/NrfG
VLVALKVAGIIVILDPTGLDAFHLAKSLFSRGMAWLLAALIVIALLRYGRAVVPRTRLHLFVLAFVAANVLSALSAENAYVAMFGEREKYLGLTFVADMLVLYSAVAVSFRRAADWGVLAVSIAVAGSLAVGYAAVQIAGLDPIKWDLGSDRAFGTFGNADTLGDFLSLVFGAGLGIAGFTVVRRPSAHRLAAVCACAVALVGATAIATRGSLLGFAAALAVWPFISMRLRGGAANGRFFVRGLIALTVLSGIVAMSPLAERVRETAQGGHVRDRVLIYEAAMSAAAERPLFGYGPDNFAVAYPRYRQPDATLVIGRGPQNSGHGWPFQIVATLGLVGLGAFLLLLFAMVRSLWTRGLSYAPAVAVPVLLATAGYLGHGLVAVDAISVDWWIWIALGTAAALQADRSPAARSLRRPQLVAAYSVVVLSLVASLGGLTALRANHEALVAKFAWERGDATASREAAAAAVRDDPGRADNWNWLGLSLDLQRGWRAAGDAYLQAAMRAPHEAAYWSNVARSRARQALTGDESSGGSAAALDAARRAVATDPNAPEPNAVLGEIANLFEDYELALDAATRAITLYRDEPSYDFIAADAALGLTDQIAARSKVDALLALRESATLRVTAAQLALSLNDRDGARRHAQRALQLDPQNSVALAILKQTGG